LTIYNPDDGAYAHATVDFAGLFGALTGMNSKGVSVMQSNLEENEITFSGFPWTLRLRYVMENAATLAEVRDKNQLPMIIVEPVKPKNSL